MDDSQIRSSFTNAERHIVDEGEFDLVSVGVDIGSSTSHLIFSRLHMEHTGSRYRIVEREILAESEILLTPYIDGEDIDTEGLGAFIDQAYAKAGLSREQIDTGALILTGVAVRRRNARAIGDLFAREAGRFVAVSAGDGLETTMAAHGSGAVALSRQIDGVVMNIDMGGGTSKIAICDRGEVHGITAVEVGARLIATDGSGVVERIETAARLFADEAGVALDYGTALDTVQMQAIVAAMVARLMQAAGLEDMTAQTRSLLRLPEIGYRGAIDAVTFSGGVSEFCYELTQDSYGDMGPQLARAVRDRIEARGLEIRRPRATLRATVIGASQYTIQVSGNTIFIAPVDAVPLRNVPVIAPRFDLRGEAIYPAAVEAEIRASLTRLDLARLDVGIAVAFHWQGSATFKRLDDFCVGVRQAMRAVLEAGVPLVLVNDGDIGGLLGLHLTQEQSEERPIVSIDGVELKEFDFIDIGALIPSSGAVPVVIKSLVFPQAVE